MRYLALTIAIEKRTPNYKEGLMRKVTDFFLEKGYFIRLVHDASTNRRGFYLFESKDNNFELRSPDDFRQFLDSHKKEGVKYELTSLKDISELLEN